MPAGPVRRPVPGAGAGTASLCSSSHPATPASTVEPQRGRRRRGAGLLELDDVRARATTGVLGGGGEAVEWLRDPRDRRAVCAASSASPSGRCELTAEYARTRVQFGRPIGDVPGGGAAARRRVHRRRGDPADDVAGGLAAPARACPARRRSRPRSSGRPTPGTGSRTPPCTCTAASASTSTTRCTDTSWPPSATSSPWAAPPLHWSTRRRLAAPALERGRRPR